jgi:hypothetical protein
MSRDQITRRDRNDARVSTVTCWEYLGNASRYNGCRSGDVLNETGSPIQAVELATELDGKDLKA